MVTTKPEELREERRVTGHMQTDEAHQWLEDVNEVIVGSADGNPLRPIREKEDEFDHARARGRRCPEREMRSPLRRGDDTRGAVTRLRLREARSLVFRRDCSIVQRANRMLQNPEHQVGNLGIRIHHPGELGKDGHRGTESTHSKQRIQETQLLIGNLLRLLFLRLRGGSRS